MWVLSTLTLFSFLSLRSRLSWGTRQTHVALWSWVARFAIQPNGTRKSRKTSSAWLTRGAAGADDGQPSISGGPLLAWLALYSHTSRHPNGTFVPLMMKEAETVRCGWNQASM